MYLFTLSVRAPLKAGVPFTTCNRIGKISLPDSRLFASIAYCGNILRLYHLTRCLVTIGAALRLSLAIVCLSSPDDGDIVPDADKRSIPFCEPSAWLFAVTTGANLAPDAPTTAVAVPCLISKADAKVTLIF